MERKKPVKESGSASKDEKRDPWLKVFVSNDAWEKSWKVRRRNMERKKRVKESGSASKVEKSGSSSEVKESGSASKDEEGKLFRKQEERQRLWEDEQRQLRLKEQEFWAQLTAVTRNIEATNKRPDNPVKVWLKDNPMEVWLKAFFSDHGINRIGMLRRASPKSLFDEIMSELNEEQQGQSVPSEILSRGPRAVKAFNSALKDGTDLVRRLPIMIIGQHRVGKTSLKKSLTGEAFSATQASTEGIETDPSHFKISMEVWKTGQKGVEADVDSKVFFDRHVASFMVKSLKEEQEKMPRDFVMKSSGKSSRSEPTEKNTAETDIFETELSDDLVKLSIQMLESGQKLEREDNIYSTLWDFGGQMVYYATHPIFMTDKAIYILTCDLSRDPYQQASIPAREGLYKKADDINFTDTNIDCLDSWLSSIYSLASSNTSRLAAALPEMSTTRLPPVFLVCTHADKPYTESPDAHPDARKMALEIYGFLRTKIYKDHLFQDVFVVDNTKSGSDNDCQEVIRLREEVLAIAKELPHLKQPIPLKWLKYENELHRLREEGHKWILKEKAMEIAFDTCGLRDDDEFCAATNFLHDQRILIHFSGQQALERMVILDLQWLIDIFRSVITIKPYEQSERTVEDLWYKLEMTGILDERLLIHAWKSLSVTEETHTSLLAIMERFSLLCSWPTRDANKQYLVPSMLKSAPTDDVFKLLDSIQVPSLFIRFELGRVPPGLFPRLVLQFYQWSKEEWKTPVNPELSRNFAQFHILPDQGTSVIFLCHSSCIEVAVHTGDCDVETVTSGFTYGNFDSSTSLALHWQLRMILESMRNEFDWLSNIRFEMCVCCPVCSLKGTVKCRAHDVRGCECLHLLSESELQQCQYCTRPGIRGDRRIRIQMFASWFSFSDASAEATGTSVNQTSLGHYVAARSAVPFKKAASEKALALPDGVVNAMHVPSCDPKGVVSQFQESLHLTPTALDNPQNEDKRWIRCLANTAKSENRKDVVEYLRTIVPCGTTGPLLDEGLDVQCVPFKQRMELTFFLTVNGRWKELAQRLGFSYNAICFLDERSANPSDVLLNIVAKHSPFHVGELYDMLVESELPGAADML
ncbi:uncharacterized protein [Montipora foliosa]|uniref:uncharacterized protein isoform X3 n=1 Tax=Montipora foliosa TaxID=591990 RepID=UPI0035F21A13